MNTEKASVADREKESRNVLKELATEGGERAADVEPYYWGERMDPLTAKADLLRVHQW